MKIKLLICGFLILPYFLLAETKYFQKGYFDIGTIHHLSDGSIIKVPYRMLTYEPIISFENINIISNSAIEFRLKNIDNIFESDISFDLRELYFEWITSIGEFSIGKQIISWGMASANNPTDNISPYNYYYPYSSHSCCFFILLLLLLFLCCFCSTLYSLKRSTWQK